MDQPMNNMSAGIWKCRVTALSNGILNGILKGNTTIPSSSGGRGSTTFAATGHGGWQAWYRSLVDELIIG